MKIVVIGSNGQLGTDLMKVLGREHHTIGLTHKEIEVTDINSCQILKEDLSDVVINTAAFHKTDQCEEEPMKTFAVNAIGAKNVAKVSKEVKATTILISTDYVFDGFKGEPYTEDDDPNPVNTYGISKLAGELYTKQNPKHYIIRVASLFGTAGASGKYGNFIETMMTKAKNNELIKVVDDMWMTPTYTKDVAKAIKKLVELSVPYGVYHATNSSYCTWFELAKEIFRMTNLNPNITPIKTQQLQMKAKRPQFSVLRSTKLPRYGILMRDWKEALHEYLIEKGHIHH